MQKKIAVLPGDGIGPEITSCSVEILKKVAQKFGHEFMFEEGLIGAVAIEKTGNPFPTETLNLCLKSDAVLFGAIGDPKYDNDPAAKIRPEQGLLAMRKSLGLYANVRPIFTFPSSVEKSPLKKEIIEGVDFVVIRELTGGIYFGEHTRSYDKTQARDVSNYSKEEILRVAKFAFELAMSRHSGAKQTRIKERSWQGPNDKPKVTLVDKANVLETSRLWRETVQEFTKKYNKSHSELGSESQGGPETSPGRPELIQVEYMFVDNAAMQIIKRPSEFDVILTENMFGDILTDEASAITGSIGMLPSASLGAQTSVYEPIHGSFSRAAGQNIANPIGSILSAAMLLDYSFGLAQESEAIFSAVKKVLSQGFGTRDIIKENSLSTTAFSEKIISSI